MDAVARIRALEGAPIIKARDDAWGPSGKLGLAHADVSAGDVDLELTVPTSANDIWDYIWQSEKEKQSTEKVQLFQEGKRIAGSRVTGISREGASPRWDAIGPEQYRLTLVVPLAAVKGNAPVEVRFFWDEKLMSTASNSRPQA